MRGLAIAWLCLAWAACAGLAQPRPDGAVRLTTPPGPASDQNAAFSPPGSQLCFTRFDDGYNDGPASIFRLDLATLAIARVSPVEEQDNVNLPGSAWSPVLDRIALASDRLTGVDLWRIAPDGSDFSAITSHGGSVAYIEPSWSPDGQWVVFEATQPGPSSDGRVSQIWKVRANGTSLTQLTSAPGYDDRQPNWAPVGNRILFQRRLLPGDPFDVWTMADDGTRLANVTNDVAADDTDASFSPDGQRIVYSTDAGSLPTANIFVIAVTGGTPTRVTNSTVEDGAPSWSPDGLTIAFESHDLPGSPSSLWRIAAPATPPVADFDGAPRAGPALSSSSSRISSATVTSWDAAAGNGPRRGERLRRPGD